ncbi:MAG: hypothetical protein ACLTYN_05260 [Dysosmobacter welbionis]
MGIPAHFGVRHPLPHRGGNPGGRAAAGQCEEEAHGLGAHLSMFDPDSELSRLCRDIRPGEAVPVSETLYTFLEQNLRSAACPAEHSTPRWGRW